MELGKIIDSFKDNIIKSTQDILKIRSVEGEGKEGMPFGEDVNKALEYSLSLSEDLGFEVKNFEGYAGHADIGQGEKTVGILVHLDVVPEGEGWKYPPYGGEIHNDKIYGRGAIDDKGPAIATLYAMKAIKDSGLAIKNKIRIIFGTNEETGWEGVKYYFSKVKAPDLAFTPDADFPVIHGEKGIMVFKLKQRFDEGCSGNISIRKIEGGSRPNMVPDSAIAVLDISENTIKDSLKKQLEGFRNKTGYEIFIEDNNTDIKIISKGISAHGSTPGAGKNAISQLLAFLGEVVPCKCGICDFINIYNEKIGMEYNGESIGVNFEDDISGKLTFNVGIIKVDEKEADVTINIRYPIKYSSLDVYREMKEVLKGTNVEVIEGEDMKPIYVDKDNFLVQKLMKVYREETGDENSEPITIGGGTYARAMNNAVAFGPLFPGQEELAHQKDECIAIDDLIKITKIYAKALYELAK